MRNIIKFGIGLLLLGILFSCESVEEKERRLVKEENERIEREIEQDRQEQENSIRIEEEKRLKEIEEEKIRLEREEEERLEAIRLEEYNKYINNSLSTGATPYKKFYGGNSRCENYGCSQIKVITPSSSDVLVTIKQDEEVVRHAYIQKLSSYTFSLPNGNYQVFFYYGQGWNPNKLMADGAIKGGFIDSEIFSKDSPQLLNNNILEYELILQQNGNFSTKPSSEAEMF